MTLYLFLLIIFYLILKVLIVLNEHVERRNMTIITVVYVNISYLEVMNNLLNLLFNSLFNINE